MDKLLEKFKLKILDSLQLCGLLTGDCVLFLVCGYLYISFYSDATALFGEARLLLSAQFYLTITIIPIICLARDFRRTSNKNETKTPVAKKRTQDIPLFDFERKRSGYAFSQVEPDYQADSTITQTALIRKYDTTIEKPAGD